MAENSHTFETWDPEGDDSNRTRYILTTQGMLVPKTDGTIIKYNLDPTKTEGHPFSQSHSIWWDTNTGKVYYYDLDNKVQSFTDDRAALNWWDKLAVPYLSDDTLNYLQGKIEADLQAVADQREAQKEQDSPETKTTNSGRVDQIPVSSSSESTTTEGTTVSSQYQQELANANSQLQNLIAQEDADDLTGASKKDETVYYNYGANEIDLKYYLHNLSTNLQSYIESKGWNQAQKNAFLKAYETYKAGLTTQLSDKSQRFTTNDAGLLIDSDGLLDGKNGRIFIDKDGNTYSSLDEISSKKLRKSAMEFSPNDEVANYFNTVGQAIVSAGKTKQAEKELGSFDLNKDGFQNYWVNKVNPAGGQIDINPYLSLDPVGPDGKRARTNRIKYLSHELAAYAKKINSGNYNFEGTPFKTKEEYLKKIQQAINNLNNGWDSSDPASLQAIGITAEFYDNMLSDMSNPQATTEEQAAEKEAQETAKLKKAMASYLKQTEAKFNDYAKNSGHYTVNHAKAFVTNTLYAIPSSEDAAATKNYQNNVGSFLKKAGFTLGGDPGSATFQANYASAVDTLWKKVRAALYEGKTSINVNGIVTSLDAALPVIMPFAIAAYFQEDTEHEGVQVDVDNYDGATGTVLCVKDGKLYFDWFNNHKGVKSKTYTNLLEKFQEEYTKSSTSTASDEDPRYSFYRQGGEIRKLSPGGSVPAEEASTEETPAGGLSPNATPEEIQQYMQALEQQATGETAQTSTSFLNAEGRLEREEGETGGQALARKLFSSGQEKAKSKGMSYHQYYLKQRAPDGVSTVMSPDSGVWKTEDFVRMGSILADITSLVLDPVSGAAVGVGSTASNFVADWLDDSVTATEMWKNLGMNLGMDALGIIPIVGDAAGTGGKLLKSIKKIAPKLMYGLTAYGILGTLKNGPNILESISKVTSDEKLTVGDYQNIAQAISALAGLNGGLKAAAAKRFATKKAKVGDAIGLGVRKKGTDEPVKDIILRGEHAKNVKKLVAEGKADKVTEYLNNLEGFADYEVNTNLATLPVKPGLPVGRTVGDDGKKHWGVKFPLEIDRKIDAFDIYDKSKLREGYASRTLLNTKRQDAVLAENTFQESDLLTKTQVDALQKQQIEAEAAAAKAARAKQDAHLKKNQERLRGKTDENGNVISEGLESIVAKQEAELQRVRDVVIDQTGAFARRTRTKIINERDAQGVIRKKTLDINSLATTKKKYNNKGELEGISVDTQKLDNKITEWETKKNNAVTELENIKNLKDQQADLQSQIDALTDEINKLPKNYTRIRAGKEAEKKVLVAELNKVKKSLKGSDQRATILQEDANIAENNLNLLNEWKKDHIDAEQLDWSEYLEQKLDRELQLSQKDLSRLRARVKRMEARPETKEKQLLYQKYANNTFNVTYGNGRQRKVADIRRILDAMNLKQGGRLKFLQAGGGVDGVVTQDGAGSWYDDVAQWYLDDIISRIQANRNFYQTVNDMQDAHHQIYSDAGGSSGTWRDTAKYSEATKNYQQRYHDLGYNVSGIGHNYNKRYGWHKNSRRTTNDSPNGGWTRDGYYSTITDDRRVLGRYGDWTDAQIQNFNNKLKGYSLEMYLNPNNNYYYIKELGANTPTVTSGALDLNELVIPPGIAGGSGDPEAPDNKTAILSKFARQFANYAPNPFEVLRYGLLKGDHKRSTEYAMRAEKPYLQTPLVDNVYIMSDLRAEAEGAKQKAELLSTAKRPMTSDAVQQMAFIKEAYDQGQKYADAGFKTSDQMRRTTTAADLAQRKENHKNTHLVGESNRLAAHNSQDNRSKIWTQYLAQKSLDRDNFLQNWEYQVEKKRLEREALAKQAAVSQMQLAVKYHPNDYGASLTPSELTAYNKILGGASYETLSDAEARAMTSASAKVSAALSNEYYNYLGVPQTPYTSGTISTVSPTFTATLTNPTDVLISKDGSKLEIAKLRVRAKNADRHQKSIEKKIDNLNKKLDRIAKSMYGSPRVEMVK